MKNSPLYLAMDIRDAIGQLAEGHAIEPELFEWVREVVVTGQCLTIDRGMQQFLVDLEGCTLTNVDTEELVWPYDPGSETQDHLPLNILVNPVLWQQMQDRWNATEPKIWQAFVERIAIPLTRQLSIVGAWISKNSPSR
jgi:hypothetical protein